MASLSLVLFPLVVNVVMELLKLLGASNWNTPGKRTLLAFVAVLGVASGSYLNGTPIDVSSVQSLLQLAFESFAAFLAAHGSYHLFLK